MISTKLFVLTSAKSDLHGRQQADSGRKNKERGRIGKLGSKRKWPWEARQKFLISSNWEWPWTGTATGQEVSSSCSSQLREGSVIQVGFFYVFRPQYLSSMYVQNKPIEYRVIRHPRTREKRKRPIYNTTSLIKEIQDLWEGTYSGRFPESLSLLIFKMKMWVTLFKILNDMNNNVLVMIHIQIYLS